MTDKQLQGYYDDITLKRNQLIEAEKILEAAKRKYCKENGLQIGTKVKIKRTNRVGIVADARVYHWRDFKIQYKIHKITKSGKAHKTASINWWSDVDEIEVIK